MSYNGLEGRRLEPQMPDRPAVRRELSPWRKAMNYVLMGLVLGSITLDFGGLNVLLPALGRVMVLLGLRDLRRENGAFRVWWWCFLAESGVWAAHLLRKAAPGWQAFDRTTPGLIITGLGFGLGLIQFLCLWRGLRTLRRGAELKPGAGGALVLAAWQLGLLALALSGLTQVGWLFLLVYLIAYFCSVNSLYKQCKELDEAGYVLQPAPARMPGWALAGIVLAALVLGVAAVSLTCSRLPMDWQPVDQEEHSQVEAVKAQLAGLGFPEDVLADLSAGDIAACQGAVRVESEARSFSLTSSINDEPKPLKITGAAVELAGGRWRMFHHIQWENGTGFYGTEAVKLWQTYYNSEGWAKSGEVEGRLLCSRNGTALWSPCYSMEEETYTSTNVFFGSRTSTDLFAQFSFPGDGENCRGYFTYETVQVEEGWLCSSWINYAHLRTVFQYPAVTAKEWMQTVGENVDSEPFLFVQDAIQFWP